MPTEVDYIRTVFEAQFMGQNAVRTYIRQMGLAEKAAESLAKTLGIGGRGGAASAVADMQRAMSAAHVKSYQKSITMLADEVMRGEISMSTARTSAELMRNNMDAMAASNAEAAKATGFLSTGLGKAALVAGGAAVAIGGVALALKTLYPLAAEGAGLAQLESSFDRLNEDVLKTPNLLNDMRDAAQGTISSFDAMEGFLTLTAGASEENAKQFARFAPELMEIAKAANKLNPRLGDTEFMFNSLSRGIKRSEQRLVDNLGLNVKFGEANKKLAKELGVSVQALTAEQKQMAALNETLRVGRQLLVQVGGDVSSLTDKYLRLGASVEEWKAEMKIAIADFGIWGGVEGLADFVDNQAMQAKALRALNDALDSGAISQERYNKINDQRMLGQIDAGDVLRTVTAAEQRYAEAVANSAFEVKNVSDVEMQRKWVEPPSTEPEIDRGKWGGTWGDDRGVMVGTDVWDRSVWSDAEVDMKSYNDIAEETADRNKKAEEAFLDLTKARQKHSEAVREAHAAQVAATGDWLMDISGEDAGYYTKNIEDIGDAWVNVGGRTYEQNQILKDLRAEQDRAKDTLRDYTSGVKGYGMEQGKVNEKIQDAAGAVDYYQGKIDDLVAIQGDLVKTTVQPEWDMEKVYADLIDFNDEAGASAFLLADLKRETGEWGDEQVNAALGAAAMVGGLKEIADEALPAIEQLEAINQLMRDIEKWQDIKDYDMTPIVDQGLPDAEAVDGIDRGIIEAEEQFNISASNMASNWETYVGDMATELENKLFPGVGENPESVVWPVNWQEGDIEAMRQKIESLPTTHYVQIIPTGGPGGYNPVPDYPEYASGGHFSGNTPFIVGEKGPEIIYPQGTSGYVAPNSSLGGNTYNNHYYNAQAAAIGAAQMERIRRGY